MVRALRAIGFFLSFLFFAQAALILMPLSVAAEPDMQGAQVDGTVTPETVNGTTALNWSGYEASNGRYTAVSGSWTVPAVAPTVQNGADATWVGIGGVTSHDLIQAGTEAVPDSEGGTAYVAWYELLPRAAREVPLTVSPGDHVSVSIREVAPSQWKISIVNDTTGASFSTTVAYESSYSSAEWIEELPTGVDTAVSLDDFGSISIEDARATKDGEDRAIASLDAAPLTMTNSGGESVAVPSDLHASGFTVTRTSADATPLVLNAAPQRVARHYRPRIRIFVEPF